MKARNENGTIVIYPTLPGDYKNILNFAQASIEVLEAEGFFDLSEPKIDPATHKLGEIYFDEVNRMFCYLVIELTQAEIDYETALQGWHNRECSMRIIAPDALLIQAPGIETWARYKGLPVVVEGGQVYLYCDTILPEHQGLLSTYQDLITIENRPTL